MPTGHHPDAELAIAAARAAGDIIMESFGTDLDVTMKSPDQPLTKADLAADRIIADMLRSSRPGYGWLSEETADSSARLDHAHVWIVDPIDGTRSFIAGRREFAVSVALAERGEAAVGVILNPATGELYWAVKGSGAWRRATDGSDHALRVRGGPLAGDDAPLLLASRSEIARGHFEDYRSGWNIEGVGSTAYKMARVAAGLADGFVSRGPKSEWDVCAAALLVTEAGGIATDAQGAALAFNREDPAISGIVAAAPSSHRALLNISLQQAKAES